MTNFSRECTALAILATVAACQQTVRETPRDCGGVTLRRAAAIGDVDTLRPCLDGNSITNQPDANGVTLLMIAAARGHGSVVEMLLSKGANPNARTTKDGVTPLMFAAAFNHLPVVQTLVKHGADVKSRDAGGRRTAVEWAIWRSVVTVAGQKPDKAAEDAIVKYLATQGGEVRQINFVEGILIFGGMPDITPLIEERQARTSPAPASQT